MFEAAGVKLTPFTSEHKELVLSFEVE
jgi:hypothetical protein